MLLADKTSLSLSLRSTNGHDEHQFLGLPDLFFWAPTFSLEEKHGGYWKRIPAPAQSTSPWSVPGHWVWISSTSNVDPDEDVKSSNAVPPPCLHDSRLGLQSLQNSGLLHPDTLLPVNEKHADSAFASSNVDSDEDLPSSAYWVVDSQTSRPVVRAAIFLSGRACSSASSLAGPIFYAY